MSVDDHLRVFVEECRESIDTINDGLLALETDPDDDEAMDAVFRAAHTVKGNAAAVGFDEASSLAHAVEDLLDEVREGEVRLTAERVDLLFEGVDALEGLLGEIDEHGETRTDTSDLRDRLRAIIEREAGAETIEGSDDGGAAVGDEAESDAINTIRVDVDQLDELYGLVERLVTSRIRLREQLEGAGVEDTEAIDQLDELSESLQNTVTDMRLVPFTRVVRTFPRLVRDTARDLGKEVSYETEGANVELDRTTLTEIRDPLVHIIRNSLDHGIEPPDEREEKGKPRRGTIRLEATRERGHVTITVSDDGAGLDPEAIAERAVELGVVDADEREAMGDSAVLGLIFEPGFSTTEEVTDVSGRGVGMDVVKSTVERLDGSVSVDSTPGEGTTVTLRLPVTMALVETMFVRAGEGVYGVPVENVDEVSDSDDIEEVRGDPVVRHADTVYPVVNLDEALDVPDDDDLAVADGGASGAGVVLRIREEERAVALACDRVVEREEVVVKPPEGALGGTPGVGGTTVLGDGEIVPVLDVTTL